MVDEPCTVRSAYDVSILFDKIIFKNRSVEIEGFRAIGEASVY